MWPRENQEGTFVNIWNRVLRVDTRSVVRQTRGSWNRNKGEFWRNSQLGQELFPVFKHSVLFFHFSRRGCSPKDRSIPLCWLENVFIRGSWWAAFSRLYALLSSVARSHAGVAYPGALPLAWNSWPFCSRRGEAILTGGPAASGGPNLALITSRPALSVFLRDTKSLVWMLGPSGFQTWFCQRMLSGMSCTLLLFNGKVREFSKQ